ncbi:MAG: sulfurtransferase [Acidobacteria bacterium]|nr:sulfurtransferase [Acidobacteriota bacterium]
MVQHHSPRFLALVEEARQHIEEISASELKAKLENKDSFYLVDVREEDEYAAGRLPGALHLCKGILERDIETTVPDSNAQVVLYCRGGYRSALAAEALQKMGYTQVSSLAGGWRGWVEAGLPTEKKG